MIAAHHGRQQRLPIGTNRKCVRLSHDIHWELIGAAPCVLMQLDPWEEDSGDPSAVLVSAETPGPRAR